MDYYTGTTFEFVHDLLGAQSGIGGGGGYAGLMEEIGGQSLPGIGFGLGIDRALLAAEAENVVPTAEFASDLYLIPLGAAAKSTALIISESLRDSNISCEIAFGDRSLKGAMKAADKSRARYVIVLGESELASGEFELKHMASGSTSSVTLTSLVQTLQQALSVI